MRWWRRRFRLPLGPPPHHHDARHHRQILLLSLLSLVGLTALCTGVSARRLRLSRLQERSSVDPCVRDPWDVPNLAPRSLSGGPPFQEGRPENLVAKPGEAASVAHLSIRRIDRETLEKRIWFLSTVAGLLRKHNVPFWLDAGTLIGAYRHGRFLPWDDDVDLAMPISAQNLLLGPVKREAAAAGIEILQLFFPPQAAFYRPAIAYVQRHAPRVAATSAADYTWGTAGYFASARYQGLKLDLWQAFPVELDGKVLYSTGGTGSFLFSRHDVFPLRSCRFEGAEYPCPARSHRYLAGVYGEDLAVPKDWRSWWDPASCTWDRARGYHNRKAPRGGAGPEARPANFATLVADAFGVLHIVAPNGTEVDTPAQAAKGELGRRDAYISEQPSGFGLPGFQLATLAPELPTTTAFPTTTPLPQTTSMMPTSTTFAGVSSTMPTNPALVATTTTAAFLLAGGQSAGLSTTTMLPNFFVR